jgi:hypothetical protein
MFHHDPLHSDDDLEALLARAQDLWDDAGESPELARERTELTFG